MKAKFLLIPAVVGLLALNSCKKGASEETTKAIAEFETAWGALGQQATTWSEDLKASVDKCGECCAKTEATSTEGMSEELKAKFTEAGTACKNDKAAFESMWMEWETFKTTWDEATKAFGEWKEKVNKGEVDDETAKKSLAEFQTKMDETKGKMEGWGSAYTAAKENCMKDMTACANVEKMAADAAEADKGKKK